MSFGSLFKAKNSYICKIKTRTKTVDCCLLSVDLKNNKDGKNRNLYKWLSISD